MGIYDRDWYRSTGGSSWAGSYPSSGSGGYGGGGGGGRRWGGGGEGWLKGFSGSFGEHGPWVTVIATVLIVLVSGAWYAAHKTFFNAPTAQEWIMDAQGAAARVARAEEYLGRLERHTVLYSDVARTHRLHTLADYWLVQGPLVEWVFRGLGVFALAFVVERRFGWWRTLLLIFGSALAGAASFLLFKSDGFVYGASAVTAGLGVFCLGGRCGFDGWGPAVRVAAAIYLAVDATGLANTMGQRTPYELLGAGAVIGLFAVVVSWLIEVD